MEIKMEGNHGHGGHEPTNNDDCFIPKSKKLVKIEEFGDKNPFQAPMVILDIIFKQLSFEDVKKFRLVSSAWNQVGSSELSRRPQKPIQFHMLEKVKGQKKSKEKVKKLGSLVRLQRRHNKVFPGDTHQLFSNFSFSGTVLMNPQIHQIFKNFSPKFVKLSVNRCDKTKETKVRQALCNFLVKISPTIQEIDFDNLQISNDNRPRAVEFSIAQKLTRTKFPNLRKISNHITLLSWQKMFFYPLIGQNSPKLNHLQLETSSMEPEITFGRPEYVKYKFEQAGLMSKLKILDINYFERPFDQEILKILTEFGANGVLKLTKLKIEQRYCRRAGWMREVYAPLIGTQAGNLKIFEISINHPLYIERALTPIEITSRVPFPTLQNLSFLQIDYFSGFAASFEPINFSLVFPNLVEFRTCDSHTFLTQKLGLCGDSIKSLSLFRDSSEKRRRLMNPIQMQNKDKKRLKFDTLIQIFPNLQFLDMNLDSFYPSSDRSLVKSLKLRKVVIHCELQDLFSTYFDRKLLQEAKKVILMVDSGFKLINEVTFKNYLGRLMQLKDRTGGYDTDFYTRSKYYQKFLKMMSKDYSSLPSVSFVFIGYQISEDYKRDIRAKLHHSAIFICTSFKSAEDHNLE